MTSIKHTIWIGHLTVWSIVYILCTPRLRGATQLAYIRSNDNAQKWLNRLISWKWLRLSAEAFEIVMGGKHIKDGRALFLFFHDQLIHIHREVCDKLWQRCDLASEWYECDSIPRVRLFLESQLANEIHDAVQLAAYVLWRIEQEQADKRSSVHLLGLPRARWGIELKPQLEKLGLGVSLLPGKEDHIFPRWCPLVVRSVKFALRSVRSIYPFARVLVNQLLSPNQTGPHKSEEQQPQRACKISVLNALSTYQTMRNDLFWFAGSGLEPQKVLVSFEWEDRQASHEELAHLRQHGFGYVIRTQARNKEGDIQVWQHTSRLKVLYIRSIRFLLRLLPHVLLGRARCWQWMQLARFAFQVDRWQDFFESNEVRIDIRLDKTVIARCVALDNIDGIAVSVQWSAWEDLHPQAPRSSQVFFLWGTHFTRIIESRPSPPETTILSGYIFDRYIPLVKSQAEEIRRTLDDAGAEFVISLFDERVMEHLWPEEMLIEYYTMFLTECLSDPTLGLVIKSKSTEVFG